VEVVIWMMDLIEDEVEKLRLMIKVFSVVSTTLGGLVVLTFLMFEEKRKVPTAGFVFFEILMITLFDGFLTIPGFYGDLISSESGHALCQTQAAAFVFLGVAVPMLWFLFTVSLFRRIHYEKEDLNAVLWISVSMVISIVAMIIPLFYGEIAYEGMWCFIGNSKMAVLYTCSYGPTIVLSFLATPLWIVIVCDMKNSLREENARKPSTATNASNFSEETESEYEDVVTFRTSVMSKISATFFEVSLTQRIVSMFRHVGFATGFLVIFYIMLVNRIIVTVYGWSYSTWLIDIIMIGNFGVLIFLVFGLTERNLYLWKEFFLTLFYKTSDLKPNAFRNSYSTLN